MTGHANTAAAGVAWVRRQLGASAPKVERWNRQAPGEWCGVFLAAAMRAMGLTPPSGYQAAHSWSTFGTEVKPGEQQPGDVLVYGFQHVGMYVGQGQMISGNWSGVVGASAVPATIKGTPLTAIRRPPYGNIPTAAERKKHERVASEENITKKGLGGIYGVPGLKQSEEVVEGEKSVGSVAGEIIAMLEQLLGEKAVPILLNIGLLGGGAFLAYFGVARMVGVDHPVKTPVAAAGKATVAAEAA